MLPDPPAPLPAPVEPIDGPSVDGFEILAPAGAGGMGEVWKAIQVAEQRVVALKIMRSLAGMDATAQSRAQDRFRREIAIAGQFDHPALVRVMGSGVTDDGRLYAAMEWVEGEPLDDYLRTPSVTVEARVRIVLELARGVQHLHEHGCTHRDLKPANVLVSPAGVPKILDFGLARTKDPVEFTPTVTMAGETVGTPHFMAPEQVTGDAGRVGPPADVWALGILLFFAATGDWPHDPGATAAEVMQRIIASPLPGPRSRNPRTPRDLEAIVLKCLERSPSARYPTAAALADDLQRFLAFEPVSARQATLGYILWRTVRRHRAAAALTLGLLLTASGGVAWHAYSQAATNRRLQAALDEAMNLRSFLLLDLRWDFETTGREDILLGVAERAHDFAEQAKAAPRPRGPRFDQRRFEALAANLRGQAAAFRENFADAMEEFSREHRLNTSLLRDFPDDPLVALDTAASAANATSLLLRLEKPNDAIPLLEAALALIAPVTPSHLPPEAANVPITRQQLQLHLLLARARREAGLLEASRLAGQRLQSLLAYETRAGGPRPDLALLTAESLLEEAQLAQREGDPQQAVELLARAQSHLQESDLPQATRSAALAVNHSESARALTSLRDFSKARKQLLLAENYLVEMRRLGIFEPSMWRERQVARAAQDMAERLLDVNQPQVALEVLHLSVRLLEVRYHRPASVRVPNADFIRQHELTARTRRFLGNLSAASAAFERALDGCQRAMERDPDNPHWIIEAANFHLSIASVINSAQWVKQLPKLAEHHQTAATLLNQAAAHPNLTPELEAELARQRQRLPPALNQPVPPP